MSDPVLHIKDSYYFEVPKFLAPARYKDKSEFPNVWVKNDAQFQEWEAERLYHGLEEMAGDQVQLPDEHDLIHDWQHWQHEGANHENFAKPLDVYLESFEQRFRNDYNTKYGKLPEADRPSFEKYLSEQEAANAEGVWFARLVQDKPGQQKWTEVKEHAGGNEVIEEFQADAAIPWSAAKIAGYNDHLSGKILLYPQPFGDLKNLYEPEPGGFAISKFMVLELVVGILLFVLFSWVAGKVRSSTAPKGRLWNLFEVFLLFIRDQIARPAIGGHEDDHEHGGEKHGAKEHHLPHTNHSLDAPGVAHSHGEGGELPGIPTDIPVDDKPHAKAHAQAHHRYEHEADRFVPLLWTIFFFLLGCNLFGLIPWLGSPTGNWSVTLAMALVTFTAVCLAGMIKFGFIGFFLNQVPGMDLPWYMAIVLKPMIFVIEMMGLLIKHMVLSIRLLANMVAGHMVILGLMGLAFTADAALTFQSPDVPGWLWYPVAAVTLLSVTAFNLLELFVAFLQAYVFTFLSALFIGAAVHKH